MARNSWIQVLVLAWALLFSASCSWLLSAGISNNLGGLPSPADVIIFAPHPDDESLAFAGVIMQTIARGKRIHLVTFTNGDGYSLAAAAACGKPVTALEPSDMLELGGLRQAEELAAVAVLGLHPDDVTFLGYPDGGLRQVYQTTKTGVYTHSGTQKCETYGLYQTDYHSIAHGRPAAYRKFSVLADITEIIHRVAPSQIYVTHPEDTHPDHRAVFWFVRDAVQALNYKGRIYTAMIHAGKLSSWPLPSGATPKQAFAPLPIWIKKNRSIPWPPVISIPLSAKQAQKKLKAIQAHHSQTQLKNATCYLESFVKNEEIFWSFDVPTKKARQHAM